MAEIYKRPQNVPIRLKGRDKLNFVVAHHAETQAELEVIAEATLARARGILDTDSKHRTGTSQIIHERGHVDHYITLVDEQAIDIEFDHQGRKAPSPLRKAYRII